MKKFEKKLTIILPLIVFLIAFSIRILWIGKYMGQDEVYYVGYSSDVIHGRSWSNVFPPFFEYFLAPFMIIFNESEVVVHVLLAILGTINVLLVYQIGSKFLNKWVGLIAALLLSFNTTHWFFSDFGMLDVPATLFATAGLYFYWLAYKQKKERDWFLGMLFTLMSVGTRYGIFPSVALIGYLFFFDRKLLKDRRILVYLFIPLIFFGLWMLHYMTNMTWLWNWWYSYLTGQLDIKLPWYIYFQSVYNEYLLPILTFFVLFASAFLLSKRYTSIKEKYGKYIFLVLFIAVFSYIYFYSVYLKPETEAFIGLLALSLLCLNYWKGKDVNKYLIFIIISVLVFYSPISVKFARYVMIALPAVYLLIGQLIYDIRKSKIYFIVAIIVLLAFVLLNSDDTVRKLVVDMNINVVKHSAQQYIIDNSKPCSTVLSKTWYGFYYLRTRISDLPSSLDNLKSSMRSNCECPPVYIVSEGFLDYPYLNDVTEKEKEFSTTVNVMRLTEKGFVEDTTNISPVYIYRIKDSLISEVCSST